MNIYTNKKQWKLFLFVIAVIIGISSLTYTNILIKKLSVEERKKVELWAEGTKQLAIIDDPNQDFSFIVQVITNNETVPVILVDENNKINAFRNLDSIKSKDEKYLYRQLEKMKSANEPIEIILGKGHKNYIYYKDSTILTQLIYYPFLQLGVIALFILVSYFAFSYSRKSEQNQVWVGMSKETAHQLGTPISSLMAWHELIKQSDENVELVNEVEKDIKRLELITERFSKIGAAPYLKKSNIAVVINNAVNYIKTRTSDKIVFNLDFSPSDEIMVPVNSALFEWVIENICKNAVDSMNGRGNIDITLQDKTQVVYIDIKDSGKGIQKSKYKTIFQPGYTTKDRGWGLGLSLSKRIIEQNHSGKVFVKSSELNQGTIIRIVLKKNVR